ncbi:ABC transporter permease [Pelagicoccus sp. SDUM812005]|uniref:ABC transporter permease n=1 Tax=Pelagicoccus sp. SDUM812005 TaxID=3041257 RepID=UPI00280F574D|nr:ABC transporter permease [Pelagicoccus sp. SDUM812005]MDQ8181324.1 ABC transporter permease [Pelagicoccus sp. SDUM812005]
MKLFTASAQASRSIVTHWHLTLQLATRNIQMQYRGSYLGVVWTLLSPLMMLGIYSFVFGYVFSGSFNNETPLQHALGIFVGLAIHNFFAETIVLTPTLIQSHASFVKKVVFPLETLVIARLIASLLTLAIKSALIVVAALLMGNGISLAHLGIFAMLPIMFLMATGIGMLFASIGVVIKDLGNASQFMSMALLFGSAVFYPIDKIPPAAWTYLQFNPLVYMIDGIRDIVLWNQAMPLENYTAPAIAAVVIFLLGNYVFQKLRPSFPDYL